ncbi:MAG: ferric reductase-like transmembrane domain-containing protein [Phycisphaerae bacterium]|nr:ferric reductase-like transmembrane domain-containing protein [Phycisphaerae bacterium]
MSASYTGIGWNRQKRIYDAVMIASIVIFLGAFYGLGRVLFRPPHDATDETLLIRGLGSCAIIMLHIVLWIGPLARLQPRLAPLLYNRRHLGVGTFVLGLCHAAFATVQFHGFGNVNPLVSLLTSNTQYGSLARFPFEVLGLAALLILFLMAATSHDFWNRNLTPRFWKSLHMCVYGAYALLVAHVSLGTLQQERSPLILATVGVSVAVTIGLHLAGARREARTDRGSEPAAGDSGPWIDAGPAADLPMDRARIVCARGGERIAVFRHAGGVSAVSNVCRHQGGPLGEGKIVDGCVTCPWHGWQYRPGDGCSPPPFKERVETYRVRIVAGRVRVNPTALAPGTPVEPAVIEEGARV